MSMVGCGSMSMRITSAFSSSRPTVSFEFFPPKTDDGETLLWQAIKRLQDLQPDFVSITRTGEGTSATLRLTTRIQSELGIRSMSHLTCVHHSEAEMAAHLDTLWEQGVQNVLALRGDLEPGQAVPGGKFQYATDLVQFAANRHPFCIGVAGYPEGHPQCLNITRDIEHLKSKLDAGASFIITQLFFDNDDLFRWRDMLLKHGIDVPLVAGIMPITNVSQIKRFVTRCGAKIAHPLLVRLEAA
ncbi:MAG: methylenetetrahydrofolate reductase, partial [Armatimonadota bacterium]